MPPRKSTKQDIQQERRQRAEDWKLFRKNNLLTQRRMALATGISRRTIQQIEGGHLTPRADTLRNFIAFRNSYDKTKDIA